MNEFLSLLVIIQPHAADGHCKHEAHVVHMCSKLRKRKQLQQQSQQPCRKLQKARKLHKAAAKINANSTQKLMRGFAHILGDIIEDRNALHVIPVKVLGEREGQYHCEYEGDEQTEAASSEGRPYLL